MPTKFKLEARSPLSPESNLIAGGFARNFPAADRLFGIHKSITSLIPSLADLTVVYIRRYAHTCVVLFIEAREPRSLIGNQGRARVQHSAAESPVVHKPVLGTATIRRNNGKPSAIVYVYRRIIRGPLTWRMHRRYMRDDQIPRGWTNAEIYRVNHPGYRCSGPTLSISPSLGQSRR